MNSSLSLSLPQSAIHSIVPLPPNRAVQLPRDGNSATEDSLAEANKEAYDRIVNGLNDLIPDFRFDRLATTTDDNRFQIAPIAEQGAGRIGPLDLDAIQRDLVRVFGCEVDQNAVEPNQSAQWTEHDQFVIQETGASRWRITGLTELSPLPGFSNPAVTGEEVWTGELPAGGAMYIPRGWGFETMEAAGATCFTLRRWTGLDVIRVLAGFAGEAPLLRANTPVDVAAPTFAYENHLYDRGAFATALSEFAALENIDAAVSRLQCQIGTDTAEKRAVSPFGTNATVTLAAPTGVRWVAPRTPAEHRDRTAAEHEDHFDIAFRGQLVTCAAPALAAIAKLVRCEPVTVGDLEQLLPDDLSATDMVTQLAGLSLVHVVG